MINPTTWVSARIGDLCDLINGKAFKPEDWSSKGLPIIRIQNLNNPEAKFNHYEGPVEPRFLVQPGELLFAWSGTPGTSFGAHVWKGPKAVLNQHIFRVVFDPEHLSRDYLRLAINSKLEELIGKAHGGVGLAHVTKGKFEATEIQVPPLPEQRRIVAKIESMSARSKRARAELDKARELTSRAVQAIIDRGVAGALSRRDGVLEDVQETLDGVRRDRLASKQPSRRKAVLPVAESTIPEKWAWVSPDELASDERYSLAIGPFGSSLVRSDYRPSGTPLIFVRDIRRGVFDHEGNRFVDQKKAEELRAHIVSAGDLLITKMGDPPGDVAIYPKGKPEAVITADCIKFRPHQRLAIVEYLEIAMKSTCVKRQMAGITAGVAHQKVSLDRFRSIALPVPPLDEQRSIVSVVTRLLGRADGLADDVEKSTKLLDRLDQSIVAKAFQGELVPQDPTDEPASVLVDRIRAKRGVTAAAPKRRGKQPSAATAIRS